MPASEPPPEVTLWCDAAHAPWVGPLLDVLGAAVQVIAVAGPDAAATDLARHLHAPATGDLRQMLVSHPAGFLLIAADDVPAVADLRAALDDGTIILSVEPLAADLPQLDALQRLTDTAGGHWVQAPRFERCPGFLAAAEPFETLSHPAMSRFSSHGPRAHGSLLARALDGWRTLLRFLDFPETIDASLHSPAGFAGSRGHERPSLREITGRLAALARLADGGSVVLDLADTAADADLARLAPRRVLQVLSDVGELVVTDAAYELVHPATADQPALADRSPAAAAVPFIDLVANHWRRLLDRPPMPINPTLERRALACVQAMHLSARTQQPESPGRLLELTTGR